MVDDLLLIGIPLDVEFKKDDTSKSMPKNDIVNIFITIAQAGPYVKPCFEVIESLGLKLNKNNDREDIPFYYLFKALDSAAFIRQLPLFLNQRSTFANIKVIKSIILILKAQYNKQITSYLLAEGLIAYQLMERELNSKERDNSQKLMLIRDQKNQEIAQMICKINKLNENLEINQQLTEKEREEIRDEIKKLEAKLNEERKKQKQEKISGDGSMYLPLDEKILNQTMRLINRVMPENIIKKWVNLVRKQLDCFIPDRLKFQEQVRQIENDIKKKNFSLQNVSETPLQTDYLLPHEFLYLICNALERQKELEKQKAPALEKEQTKIDEFNPDNVNGIRLDYIYKLDCESWQDWISVANKQNMQPCNRIIRDLNQQNQNKKAKLSNVTGQEFVKSGRNLEEDTQKAIQKLQKQNLQQPKKVSNVSDTTKGEVTGSRGGATLNTDTVSLASSMNQRRSAAQNFQHKKKESLSIINENKLFQKPCRTFDKDAIKEFQEKISDPKFFDNLKAEVQIATYELSKTRLGGQISMNYLNSIRDISFASPMKQLLKNSKDMNEFLSQKPKKGMNIEQIMEKKVKQMLKYPNVQEIHQNVWRIRQSQKKAIQQTQEALKETKDNIFSQERVDKGKTNKTVISALRNIKPKQEEETAAGNKQPSQIIIQTQGQRKDEDQFKNKDTFVNVVKVQHKEPTEPNKPTYYGVMKKVFNESYEQYKKQNLPSELAKEEEKKMKEQQIKQANVENQKLASTPTDRKKMKSAKREKSAAPKEKYVVKNKEGVTNIQTQQLVNDAYSAGFKKNANHQNIIYSQAQSRPMTHATNGARYSVPINSRRIEGNQSDFILATPLKKHGSIGNGFKFQELQSQNDLDCVSTPYYDAKPRNFKQSNQSTALERVDDITDVTCEIFSKPGSSLRPVTSSAASGTRVRSAAASFIFRKWGYDTTKLLKNRSIDLDNFMTFKSLKKDHLHFMQRIDNELEKECVQMDQQNKMNYDYINISDPVMRAKEIAMLKKCPPVKEVYTKLLPKKQNILD